MKRALQQVAWALTLLVLVPLVFVLSAWGRFCMRRDARRWERGR
jgi:hypothetical protein